MHKELICMMIIVKKKRMKWFAKKYLFNTKEDSSKAIKEQKESNLFQTVRGEREALEEVLTRRHNLSE